MAFDFTKPKISTVSYDLAGKTIVIWGSNRLGKTKQATRLPKPCYLMFEAGLAGISGVPYFTMNRWEDYTAFVNWASTNAEQARELYSTIILDELSVMGRMCADYVAASKGVGSLDELDWGRGYKALEVEFERYLSKLTKCGFTVMAIGHDGGSKKLRDPITGEEREIGFPYGEKKIVSLICNLFDIIGYVYPTGQLDENGRPAKSALYMGSRGNVYAGSRFTHLVEYLPEYTAEALTKAVADAIRAEEEESGRPAVSYATQLEEQQGAVPTDPVEDEKLKEEFARLKEEVFQYATMLNQAKRMDEYRKIANARLGVGQGLNDLPFTREHLAATKLVLEDLKALF